MRAQIEEVIQQSNNDFTSAFQQRENEIQVKSTEYERHMQQEVGRMAVRPVYFRCRNDLSIAIYAGGTRARVGCNGAASRSHQSAHWNGQVRFAAIEHARPEYLYNSVARCHQAHKELTWHFPSDSTNWDKHGGMLSLECML